MEEVPQAIAELRGRPQWVVWREEQRENNKTTKVPYRPDRPTRKAKSTSPDTWGPHDRAAAVVASGQANGTGYVFAPDDGLAGVDLDGCLNLDTGEIHPGALAIVRRLDSYTEISPSGHGLHVFVRGHVKGKRNRTKKTPWGGDFEVYDHARFFTVTGRHFTGTPNTIKERPAELDAIVAEILPEAAPAAKPSPNGNGKVIESDADLLEKMFAAKNGARVEALYRGDTSGHGDDDSAADLSLCNSLAFWTGRDTARMDRIFRSSGLMRDKWDSERPGGTYGSQTIDKAVEGCREAYGERLSLTRIFTERDAPRRQACADLADLFGLRDQDDTFDRGVRTTHDSRGVVDLYSKQGRHLHLAPLNAYTTAPKMTVEVGLQLKTRAYLDSGAMSTVFALIGAICELQEDVTFEERAADLGRTYIQEAPVGDVAMNDQAEKWAAFQALKTKDPTVTARANGTSIAAESLMLCDTANGLRYIRIGWFAAYVKASGETPETVKRMPALGWDKAGDGTRGRVKATAPSGDLSLQWDFFTVAKGWEWS